MTTHPILDDLRCRGVTLTVVDGGLEVDAPAGVLTAEDRAALAFHKKALVAILSTPRPDPLERLRGPRRTPWRTLVWSDPSAPPIEHFGEAPR